MQHQLSVLALNVMKCPTFILFSCVVLLSCVHLTIVAVHAQPPVHAATTCTVCTRCLAVMLKFTALLYGFWKVLARCCTLDRPQAALTWIDNCLNICAAHYAGTYGPRPCQAWSCTCCHWQTVAQAPDVHSWQRHLSIMHRLFLPDVCSPLSEHHSHIADPHVMCAPYKICCSILPCACILSSSADLMRASPVMTYPVITVLQNRLFCSAVKAALITSSSSLQAHHHNARHHTAPQLPEQLSQHRAHFRVKRRYYSMATRRGGDPGRRT